MSDKPVLNTPGELLLEAREAAGLDLHQVEERTKIPLAILRSLELDEYHKISGPLYVNSFLRTYAADVGLDPAHILDLYVKFSGEVVNVGVAPDPEAVWVDEEVEIRRVGIPWKMIGLAAGAIVVVIIVIVWLVGMRGDAAGIDNGSDNGTAETVHESLLPESAPVGTGDAADSEVPAEGVTESTSDGDAESNEAGSTNGGASDALSTPPQTPAASPATAPARTLPTVRAGTPEISFRDGAYWPVVLRLLCDSPVNAQIIRDGDSDTPKVAWLLDPDSYPVLPEAGIQHGRPYSTRQGLVVYWGARDQFSLKLDRTSGVEISLNGRVRDITNLQPGQEIILFVP
jgi:cytoskeletal protein RodZ